MSQYKAIFCDLDGSLLTKQEKMPHADFHEWIPVFKEQKIKFIITTGRLIEAALLIYDKIGVDPELTPYIIACNGAQIYDTKKKKLLQNLEFNPEIVTKIFYQIPSLIKKFPYLQAFLYSSDGVISAYPHRTILEQLPGAKEHMENAFQPTVVLHEKTIPEQLDQLTLAHGQSLNKIVFGLYRGDFHQLQKFCYQHFKFPGVHVTFSSIHSIELSNVNCTKGLALQKVIEWLKIPLSMVIALGDAGNDISMLNLPDITSGCATWSEPTVQAVAKHNFSGQPGLWVLNAFHKLIMKNEEKVLK